MDESTSKAGKVTQALSPVKLQKVKVGGGLEDESASEERGGVWSIAREEVSPPISRCVPNHPHSKKVMKHALRQQAKRRRKNTTIAAGNSAPLPRPILVPPQAELEEELESRVRPSTMMEVLNSIPGFTLKPRKRSNKKLSPAAQLEQLQTKEGSIDLETPDSILVQTNLRFLLNKHTFASLPPLYQCKLVQLLPHVDRSYHSDSTFRLSASGLNNEFFARALQQWRERLAEGEFTPENQQKLKLEAEKEKSKLDPWKLKHFEPIWGESSYPALHTATSTAIPTVTSPEWTAPKSSSLKATIKIRPPTARLRTVGAVTRAVSSYRGKREAEYHDSEEQPKRSKSDAVQTETLDALPNHLSETSQDQTDYPATSRIHVESFVSAQESIETTSVASTSAIISSHISTAEKCSMEVEAASELTCIIPSEEVFNAPPMEMKSNEGHDSDDFIYVDPSTDFNESESETTVADESGGDKDSLLCPVTEEVCSSMTISSENDSSVNVGSLASTENIPMNQSELEENFPGSSEVTAPLPADDLVCPKDENSAVKSRESSPVNMTAAEEPEAETEVPSERLVDAGSGEPCDSIPETAVQGDIGGSENMEIFSEENDTLAGSSDNAGSESNKDSQTPIHVSISPTKSESDRGDAADLPYPAQPTESVNVSDQQQTTPDQISASDNLVENTTFSQETSNPKTPDCDQTSKESIGIPEDSSTNLPVGSPQNVDQAPPHDSSSPALENSEAKDAPSNEMSSSTKDSPPSALSESNVECLAKADNSETAESPVSSKNISSSPLAGDTNFKESESASEPPASRLSPGMGVNFKEENFEASIPNEMDLETGSPLEVSSKEMAGPAWDGVDSSTDKLSDPPMDDTREGEVAVIPMQEELEVRLEESPLPAPTCDWSDFDKSESSSNSQNPPNSVPYPGHVKLELEVTLTPEVDSQVSSTVESSGAVIAPTTIVCLPSVAAPPLPPVPSVAVPSMPSMVSSPALPYLALSTSTPVTAVRAIPTKTTPGGPSRGARNLSSKPPPGAVNLERSYQICQAVIQNSPNRDQLRSQLKPPPSSLLTKEGVKTGVLPSKGNRQGTQTTKPVRGHSAQPVLVKHVFTSSQGIPVTMAVLPPANTPEMTDGGQFLLVQRGTGLSGVRRSSSAPPANNKLPVGSVARNRPASVGIQAITRERFNGADSPVQNIYNKQQSMENCSCNLNAMVVCQKCGAFCHDDCISSSRLCLTCLIR